MITDLIIPALDEEITLPKVLAAIPRDLIRHIVVADNGSRDGTARVAKEGGAIVVPESERGYGAACLAGIAWTRALAEPPDAIAFLDGDGADDPRELAAVLAPIAEGRADLVIGSRALGRREAGSLTPQQRFGNALAVALIRLLRGHRYTDLGPFRAIRATSLARLEMADRDYGWTVEMQMKALSRGLRVVEVPVSHHRRAGGQSKISSTLRGTLGAGHKILTTIARHAFT